MGKYKFVSRACRHAVAAGIALFVAIASPKSVEAQVRNPGETHLTWTFEFAEQPFAESNVHLDHSTRSRNAVPSDHGKLDRAALVPLPLLSMPAPSRNRVLPVALGALLGAGAGAYWVSTKPVPDGCHGCVYTYVIGVAGGGLIGAGVGWIVSIMIDEDR